MANSLITKAISALQAITSPADTDLIPVGTGGGNELKKLTWSNLITAIRKALGIYSGQYVLLKVMIVTPNVPITQPYKNGSVNVTFNPPEGSTLFVPVIREGGWNTITGLTITGTTLKVDYLNIGTQAHSGAGRVDVFCFKQI